MILEPVLATTRGLNAHINTPRTAEPYHIKFAITSIPGFPRASQTDSRPTQQPKSKISTGLERRPPPDTSIAWSSTRCVWSPSTNLPDVPGGKVSRQELDRPPQSARQADFSGVSWIPRRNHRGLGGGRGVDVYADYRICGSVWRATRHAWLGGHVCATALCSWVRERRRVGWCLETRVGPGRRCAREDFLTVQCLYPPFQPGSTSNFSSRICILSTGYSLLVIATARVSYPGWIDPTPSARCGDE